MTRGQLLETPPSQRREPQELGQPSVPFFILMTHCLRQVSAPFPSGTPSRSQWVSMERPLARTYLVDWAEVGVEGSGKAGRVACWGVWGRAAPLENGSERMVAAVVARAPSVG